MVEKMRAGSRKQRLEVFAAALMALAVIGAAWASYESTRWGTAQTKNFNGSNAARVESTTLSTRGGQEVQVHVALFFQAVNAFAAGDMELFDFYVERAPDGFKPALDAWLATDPANNPDAPLTPFDLPEYEVQEFQESDQLVTDADESTAEALVANQRSDNFVLSTVVFAAILFLAGISSMFRWFSVRVALVAVATAGFVANALWIATMPVVLNV